MTHNEFQITMIVIACVLFFFGGIHTIRRHDELVEDAAEDERKKDGRK